MNKIRDWNSKLFSPMKQENVSAKDIEKYLSSLDKEQLAEIICEVIGGSSFLFEYVKKWINEE